MNIKSHACPLCGEKTLESKSDVVWCSNLNAAGGRSCQFGLGTGEKTLDDLNVGQQSNYVSSTARKFSPGNFVTEGTSDKVGVTLAVEDESDDNPRILIKWIRDLSTEWLRSEYLNPAY